MLFDRMNIWLQLQMCNGDELHIRVHDLHSMLWHNKEELTRVRIISAAPLGFGDCLYYNVKESPKQIQTQIEDKLRWTKERLDKENEELQKRLGVLPYAPLPVLNPEKTS